jgi:prepilin-type N-terminal cleavage/methylation domain-containing protein
MKRRLNKRGGFTLIELLTVIVVGSVITGAIVALLHGQMQLSSTQNRTMLNQQNLRESLDYMADEISTIGAGVDEPFISTAATTEFRFVSDIDGNPANWERVRYFLDNATLRRTLEQSGDSGTTWTAVSTDDMLTGVASLTFTYYAPENVVTTTPADITSVQIRLTQNPNNNTTALNTGRIGTGTMVVRSTLRNRLID